jgi:hypothetical protein
MASFFEELFSLSSITEASNVHQNFLDFEKAISITTAKKKKAVLSMFAIQEKLTEYFSSGKLVPYYNFDQQGSYKMNTMVLGKNGAYDIDFGIHSIEKPRITPKVLKQHIYNILTDHTQYGIINKDKCIRVVYAGDFDIDITTYYKTNDIEHPMLATNNGWITSDPKELIKWFKSQANNQGQLIRIVKYLKYWANTKRRKMPSGIALTVWIANNFKPNQRDDIAFYEILVAIKSSFWWEIKCINPTAPKDSLISKLTQVQIAFFSTSLKHLIKDCENALSKNNCHESIVHWKQIFGNKFK